MKQALIILLLFLCATTVSAAPTEKELVVVMPMTAWTGSDKAKINVVLKKFTGTDANFPGVVWTMGLGGVEWGVGTYYTSHLQRRTEKATKGKMTALKATLSNNQIEIEFLDDHKAFLASLGLVEKPPIENE